MNLERVGTYRGGPGELGGVPGFAPVEDGILAWRRGEIVRLSPDLEPIWSVGGAAGGASWVGDAVLSVDKNRDGSWNLRRLRLSDGAEMARAARPVGSVLAVVCGLQVRLECSVSSAELVALDAVDLRCVWSRAWHPGPQMAVVADELLMLGSDLNGSTASCIRPSDGTDLWAFPNAGLRTEPPTKVGGRITEMTAVDGVFLVGRDSRIYKVDPRSGDVLGVAPRPRGVRVKFGASLFFVAPDGLCRFSPSAMLEVDRVTFPSWPEDLALNSWPQIHGAAFADDTVALRTSGGDLVALRRAETGWRVRVAAVGGIVPYSEPPVIANGRIYCLDRARYELAAFKLS